MYIVISGYVKPDQMGSFKEWVQSGEAEDLQAQIQEEAGARYVETYFPILGFGEYTYETWWEVPDWATLDEMRESGAVQEYMRTVLTFVDQSRSGSTRALRTAADVKVTEPGDR